MSTLKYIFQDRKANAANPTKGKYIVVLFRLAQVVKRNRGLFIFFFWYLFLYRVFVEWFMCVELSWNTEIGPGLQLWHVHGLVVHPRTRIGKNCSLRQSTTIGVKQDASGNNNDNAPVIGDNVDIGANAVVIGAIQIGDNVSIGAGSVVVKDISPNAVAVGNPARIIKHKVLVDI